MSNNSIRNTNYNRNNKVIIKSALADLYLNQEIDLNESRELSERQTVNENRLFLRVCEIAVEEYNADLDDIRDLYYDFNGVDEYTVESSKCYWGAYYEGQPLADVLHSSDAFFEMSNISKRAIGQALNKLCDLPVGWVQHCIYARSRGVELDNPTINWRFTREDVAA